MKILPMICAAFALFACGGLAETRVEPCAEYAALCDSGQAVAASDACECLPTEMAQAEQELLADDNFGVRADTYGRCNAGVNTTCYYPPGFGDGTPAYTDMITKEWKVGWFPDTFEGSGLDTTSQKTALVAAVNAALSDVNANNGWAHWVQSPPAPFTANIEISASNFDQGFDLTDIREYLQLICMHATQLTESPAIAGQHLFCNSWLVLIDIDAIDFVAGNDAQEDSMTRHAIGSAFGAIVAGAGYLNVGANWMNPNADQDGLFANVPPTAYCRARARYDAGGSYTFLTKADNACD